MKMNQVEFAKKVGVHFITVSRWESDKMMPDLNAIKKISEVTGKPVSYFTEEKQYPITKESVLIPPQNTIMLPVIARIPAGAAAYDEGGIEGFMSIPRHMFPQVDGDDFVIYCCGESMEPRIEKHSRCIVHRCNDPINNRVMFVQTEEGFIIKRVIIKGSYIQSYPKKPLLTSF